MPGSLTDCTLPSETLLRIIALQTEIVKLGLDLGAVMDLVASSLQPLTNAAGTHGTPRLEC